MRILLKAALIFVIIYTVLVGGLLAAMRQPPYVFGRIMSKVPDVAFVLFPFKPLWLVARRGPLKMGDRAPDFNLSTADKKARVQLSSFQAEKPVVLVFGSHS